MIQMDLFLRKTARNKQQSIREHDAISPAGHSALRSKVYCAYTLLDLGKCAECAFRCQEKGEKNELYSII